MTNEQFFQQFGHFIDAPNGIQKLRELILQLAVQGKLVPQDPDDEPASVLLEKIKAEKESLIKEGKIRNRKPLAEIVSNEVPYQLPISWAWVRLGEIGDWGAGSTPNRKDSSYYDGNISWFKSGELTGGHISSSEEYVTEKALRECSLRLCQPGDVLIAMYGATIGKTAVLDVEATTNQAVCACTCYNGVSNEFLLLLLNAYKSRFTNQGAGGAQPNISRVKIVNTVSALPPHAEQSHIVVKVDELMTLCDQLEVQHKARNETHTSLIRAVHHHLTVAGNNTAIQSAWHRIHDNFTGLYATTDAVQALRQSILQLAVQGKLVPQDPDDEPASVLLERIADEKARLIEEGKIKKQKPQPEISDNKKPFELPRGWIWNNLSDITALVTDGDHQAPPKSDSGIPFLVIGNLNTGRIMFDGCRYVPEQYYGKLDWGKRPTEGDLLYTVTGSYGIPIPVQGNEKFCVQRHVAIFKTTRSTPGDYLLLVLASTYAFEYATRIATGIAQKTVPLTGIRRLPIPVPPTEEQSRIVAKVDELMILCGQLEAQISDKAVTASRYAEAIVQQIAAA